MTYEEFWDWLLKLDGKEIDQQLAKQVFELQLYCRKVGAELADVSSSLKVSRLSVKNWQDKYNQLKERVDNPAPPGCKLLGFQVRGLSGELPIGLKPEHVFDLLNAIQVLLANGKELCIRPVFEGDINTPVRVDGADLEDGDFGEP